MSPRPGRQKRLLILTLISFCITITEGAIFFADVEPFMRILLVLQNAVNAFLFRPLLSLREVYAALLNEQDKFRLIVGYLYGIAVFTSPFCTAALVYQFLERILRLVFGFGRLTGKQSSILLFGYHDDVRLLLKQVRPDRKRCIHVITADSLSPDESYKLSKKGCLIHNLDVAAADRTALKKLFRQIRADKAEQILLFEKDPLRNFSLLRLFSETGEDALLRPKRGTKITCVCEDSNVSGMISDYCKKNGETAYLLDIVSIPELQVQSIFTDVPLHSFYLAQNKPVDAWHLRMLILGFDAFGQQALLQAMQLGVITRSNKLIFDVYDRDIAAKSEVFLNRFSFETFERTENGVRIRESAADGVLEIRFHPDNVMYQRFSEAITSENAKMPYTYALIAMEDAGTAVSCAQRLAQLLDRQATPIVLRLDAHHDLSDSIVSSYPHVHIVRAREEMLSLDRIIGNQIDREAKQFNSFYAGIQLLSGEQDKAQHPSSHPGEDELWYRTTFYERCSSKAAAMHQSVKKDVWDRFAAGQGHESAEKEIRRLIGTGGSLMTCDGNCWRLNGSETQFLDALRGEPFAYETAAAEHRRWCYFIASEGWCYSRERDKSRKQHNCLMPFAALYDDDSGRTTIKYDLMPLMKELAESGQT